MVLESATLPVPSEVVLPLAGYVVYQGNMQFWLAVFVASVGSLVGTLIDYYIGYFLGREAILHYGRYIRLNENHLKTTEKWFEKHGEITVLLARFVPLVRTLVAFPAGLAEMKMWKFLLFSAVGIVIWDAALIYIGYYFGSNAISIAQTLQSLFGPIEVALVIVIVIALGLWFWRRRSAPQPPPQEQTKKPVP